MIIRKPYAFLIKYFKVIHITLFVFMTYLLFKTRNIYIFFKPGLLLLILSFSDSFYYGKSHILKYIILIIFNCMVQWD